MRVVAATWIVGALCLILTIAPAHVMEARAVSYSSEIVTKAFERATDSRDIGFGARATQHRSELGATVNPYGQVDPEWAQFATTHISGTIDDPTAYFGYDIGIGSKEKPDSYGEFGDLHSEKTILVLGDSHSQHWYPAIDIAARNLGYKVIAASATPAGSTVLWELPDNLGETWPYYAGGTLSVARNNEHYHWIRDHLWPQADYVIVAMASYKFPGDDKTPGTTSDVPQRVADTFRQIGEVTGNTPILIQDSPRIPDYTGQTTYWVSRIDKAFKPDTDYMNTLRDKLSAIGAEDSFLYMKIESLFVDDAGLAHTQIGGMPVYYDHHHINTLYSASAGEYFTEQLRELGL